MLAPIRSLALDDDGYGSPSHVHVLHGDTLLELRRQIRAHRWEYDFGIEGCPGQKYAESCTLLHVQQTIAGYAAVVIITEHFDV